MSILSPSPVPSSRTEPQPAGLHQLTRGDFRLTPMPGEKLLRIAIIGFWDPGTTARFAIALPIAVEALGTRSGEHLILADITRSAIQAQEVMNRLTAMIVRSANRARRLALLGLGTGVRMQARRLLNARENLALFDNEAEALAWLARGAYPATVRR